MLGLSIVSAPAIIIICCCIVLAMVVVAGFTLAICLAVLCIGIVCFRR